MQDEDKNLDYWKENAKDAYMTTPICVLRYITELEEAAKCSSILLLTNEEIDRRVDSEIIYSKFYKELSEREQKLTTAAMKAGAKWLKAEAIDEINKLKL